MNKALLWGGGFSLSAALLHIAIIVGGADWYRFFGAGEALARLAEQGSPIPGAITAVIALVLLLWGLYAFAGAGLTRRLPWLKPALIAITAVYLLRGLALFPAILLAPHTIDAFLVWSSAVSLFIGMVHFSGTRQMIWEHS
ncbi:MAG: hypothetical protein KZQ99_15825 [Candidatus Thiodiazotropha sp. (ex Dulcina madagascariensis)]|nr:hypothetical protein [Candidatus Thiodiazotropha sp. (ex Epidulcina cf. delphinae)]MCU7921967.1 hypothetical protein [Candidatus Thiodiazotropha sp. (ex Dulcina madagascariensis)]MCU7928406.1 hypothetical protein [Candidatus Thiodiazotropha sp. (ex Dulcina madagascariensis)]MCU7936317.1 hypothetical protein [Candidatus Thiodiazotropha sp. (ex Dulcina madagascariensis)]